MARSAPGPDQPTTSPTAPADRPLAGSGGRGRGKRPVIPWQRNLAAIWLVQILAIVGFSLRTPFLPFYLADLGVETVEGQTLWSGLINAGGAGVMALTAPFWGMVADRRGRRIMLIRAAFAGSLTVSAMAFVGAPWQLLALRLVEGSLTGTVTAATVLVATTTPKERIGFALGLLQTAVFAGSSIGPLFGGVLADRIGPRPTFLVAGSMLGLAGLLTLLIVRERFERPAKAAASAAPRPTSRWGRVRASAGPLLSGAVLALVLALFVIRFAAMAVQPIVPLFVAELAPGATDPASLAGIVLGTLGVTSAISAVLLGRMGDRRGHRAILLLSVAAAGLFYLPMAFAQNPWQLAALQALFGVAAGGMMPAANALIADRTPPERRATVYGITTSSAALGAFVGPLAGAAVAVAFGFPAAFLATGIMLLLLTVALVVGLPTGEGERAFPLRLHLPGRHGH